MMKFKAIFLFLFVLFISCGEITKKEMKEDVKTVIGQKEELLKTEDSSLVKTYNYDELAPFLNKKNTDKTYVINFWATWCKPCVDELPVFEKLNEDYKDKNVEVLLVSLDFQKEEQLLPFIAENKLQSKVVVLDDPDQNKWINAINENWSGSIPATLIYNKDKRAFYEQSFDEELLLKELQKFIN